MTLICNNYIHDYGVQIIVELMHADERTFEAFIDTLICIEVQMTNEVGIASIFYAFNRPLVLLKL